ncbi:4-hydroxy-3-methylbut-2-enyl diphosphate reductase [Aminobacterium sp. MB27-C1]|uniref:4-hydroxy-3-methylbut-2-enyl diphosphate reductase n=1 Tax=unclassified Aminobacterium TaxID=2685012 RepID=UPI0027DD9369|nr:MULTISPECIES: 4-hydroxy-3-methylbut-2-enyl diphosphate reductase [unclassified Aminobacterium]MEA4876901.1 4-hydroxy-3-methylbut-2-enyl diphosphate reductase [Aminobacterium sp.]WMI72634.1 4-hydroxy-3-methylbut-2-enyl diphosphate reductase [Aminobacterium sp. MB27-C1]
MVADPTGFCFGVRRAIETLEKILKEEGPVYSLGMPIHNPQEVERLTKKGLVVVDSPDLIPLASRTFVRAHGVSPELLKSLHERCTQVTDGTCPFVKIAQERAKVLAQEGFEVCIVGNGNHPEVKALKGIAGDKSFIIDSKECVINVGKISKIGVISQTTQDSRDFAAIVSELALKSEEMRVYNTICNATRERQDATRKLAQRVEGIIVVGGRNSANTGKLYEIARSTGVDVVWIEHAEELDRRWLLDKARVGITAGASTPDWLINQLKKIMVIT